MRAIVNRTSVTTLRVADMVNGDIGEMEWEGRNIPVYMKRCNMGRTPELLDLNNLRLPFTLTAEMKDAAVTLLQSGDTVTLVVD